MARTLTEIYEGMVAEKNLNAYLNTLQPNIDNIQTVLDDLTTQSKVAIWRLYFYVVAFAIWTVEKMWDLFKAEVEEIAAHAVAGTARWYQEQALLFQYGYTLQWIDGKFQYEDTTSPAAIASRIIKRAAVTEVGSVVRIKVATLDSLGNVAPLNFVTMLAFTAYINQIRFAGTQTAPISRPPDLLHLQYKVYYDPLKLSPTGELLSTPGVFPFEDAVNSYISNLPFDGWLELNKLNDAVQAGVGIVRPYLVNAEARYSATPYTAIIERYNPDAGYLIIDPAFPLNTNTVYIPNV